MVGSIRNPIKAAALTSGINAPSSRFRLRQYIELLNRQGIQVREYIPHISKYAPLPGVLSRFHPISILPLYAVWQGMKLMRRLPGVWVSRHCVITWLGRDLLPGLLTFEPFLKKPHILDADDAIWLGRFLAKDAMSTIARRDDTVVAGNQYIADFFCKFNKSVRIIPTAVDTDRFFSKIGPNRFDEPGRFVIGWTGSGSTIQYLEAIENPLAAFLAENQDALLMVVYDRPPVFHHIPDCQVRFIPWSEMTEAEPLRSMNVGLMPLPKNPWTEGKCAFKMLQYMATALPVIVSPVGMNTDVLAMGDVGLSAQSDVDWYEAFRHFYLNPTLSRDMGLNGRSIIEAHFSRTVVNGQITEVIKSLS